MTKPLSTFALLCAAALFAACGGRQSHEHEHSHEGHVHTSCSHDHAGHDHVGHNHTEHNHAEEALPSSNHAHNHGEGIAFTKQQAEAAGLQVELIEPAPFAGVIKTAGHIQAPKGHESVVVATAAGVLYYANPSITEGMAVKEDRKSVV